jgi:hypothetical protein
MIRRFIASFTISSMVHTLALMLPFTIKMNPFEAFAFLIGMAAVCETTGDITCILFGVPGEQRVRPPFWMVTPWQREERRVERWGPHYLVL